MIRWLVALVVALACLQAAAPVQAQGELLRAVRPAQQQLLNPAQAPVLPSPEGQGAPSRRPGLLLAADAMPLKQVLACLRGSYPGQVLDAQLFERDGQQYYRIKLLAADGTVQALIVDARTCAVVEQR
jgi:uncharacterized membrane protein YkoI